MKIHESEIQIARDLFTDAISQIEIEGRDIGAFASAALLAASELYGYVHGGGELRAAFAEIAKAEMVHSGAAGRA